MFEEASAGNKNSCGAHIIAHPKQTKISPTMTGKSCSYRSLDSCSSSPDGRIWLWGVRVLLFLSCAVLVAGLWATVQNVTSIRSLQKEMSRAYTSEITVQDLKERVALLETILTQVLQDVVDLKEDETWSDDYNYELKEDDQVAAPRVKRETIRMPSRYMSRPVPVYDKAYGIDLKKDGEGLTLYSSLQGPAENSVVPQQDTQQQQQQQQQRQQRPAAAQLNQRTITKRRRGPPASFLKRGAPRRRRPQLKSLLHEYRSPKSSSSGGLVKNRDVIYRESLYKVGPPTAAGALARLENTPGADAWDRAVSRVQQGANTTPATAPVTVTQRARKRPRKRNSRRRRRGSRATAAHFTGLPAATGRSGVWEGADWMEGLGLNSRYKTGGDHVKVVEPGIYLLYSQVKYGYGSSSGYDVKINGRTETSCTQGVVDQGASTCHTSVVAYLPKNSVVRLEGHAPGSAVLQLKDGEHASLGLVKLLEAPDTYQNLFSD